MFFPKYNNQISEVVGNRKLPHYFKEVNMEEVIKVRGLFKSYSKVPAVSDLSFSVRKNSVFGLLGANGAGKTTSIECILGTRNFESGSVSIMGMDPAKERKILFQKVGVQFQDLNYQKEIRVIELCWQTSSLYRCPCDFREMASRFGLEQKMKSYVKNLSGGERQKLFVMLALIPDPEILFLDELTTGLDVRSRRDVWQIIKELKQKGITILLTSHFMEEVEMLCDEICILKKGVSAFYGTTGSAVEKSPCKNFEEAYLWYSGEEVKANESI